MNKVYIVKSIMNRLFEQIVKSKTSQHYSKQSDEYFNVNEGIHFRVKIDAHSYGYERDGNTCRPEWRCHVVKYYHVIMLYPHNIFVCVTDDSNIGVIPPIGWENTSNHNSCWRNGCDTLSGVAYECWEEAFALVPEAHRPSSKDEGVDITLDLSMMGDIFELVSCDIESDYETDASGYFKKISNIIRIKKKLTI